MKKIGTVHTSSCFTQSVFLCFDHFKGTVFKIRHQVRSWGRTQLVGGLQFTVLSFRNRIQFCQS